MFLKKNHLLIFVLFFNFEVFSSLLIDSEIQIPNCAICLDDIVDVTDVAKIDCIHKFHLDCMEKSCTKNPCCPLCRQITFKRSLIIDSMNFVKIKDTVRSLRCTLSAITDLTIKLEHEQTFTLYILRYFPFLQKIKINESNLQTISLNIFDPLKHLTEIDFSDNNLSLICDNLFEKNLKLKKLILSKNKLKKIPKSINLLSNLKELDISENQLSKFPIDIISSLSSLAYLKCDVAKFQSQNIEKIIEILPALISIKN